ncbi:uncharacterized protein LOC108917285 isoform X2 [Anoplophora glabripennis]|uniref:uncharacterized protein LOC108917285 isoform X2 n=1 Tax=Anoplophora glabripennis TaxID=217634 RepID=UPI000874FAE1|nr:uncharacterized protein LOC108917285 isoform X2 [Anoplophora glabripennis]
MFDKMDKKAFKGTDTGTELTKVTVNGAPPARATTTCTPEVCRSARQRFQPPDLSSDSPWNQKKTYFFIGTLVIFAVWIVIYSIVSELKLV